MARRKKKILFITERRADYSHLKPIIQAVKQSQKLKSLLVVTGAHLLKSFGETRRVIEKDGFKIHAILPIFTANAPDEGSSMVKALGKALIGFADIFLRLKPDLVFTGFDIGANFAAAIAGMHMNIHVSHIHGGEVSGTIDEVIRHGLTKFSHIHFAASKQSRNRIIKLGENPKYVFFVGSPSILNIKGLKYLPKKEIFKKYGLHSNKRLILFIQHSVTTEVSKVIKQIGESIKALGEVQKKYQTQCLAVYSNNDAGGKRIVKRLIQSGIKLVPHILHEDFLNLMKYADVLVGNSSAGILESPSFGLPTVNIGTRQQFRERGRNVIDADHQKDQIVKAIEKALFDQKFIHKSKTSQNPYDGGDTGKKVVKILENLKFPPLQKVITY